MGQLENKICAYCGKKFHQNSSSQKYCSAACRIDHRKMIYQANFVSKKHTVEKVCEICGKRFIANTLSQKYCCTECKVIAGHEKSRQHKKEQRAKEAEEKRKAKLKKPIMSIREITRLALAEHLSYGRYCQKYGL